MFFLPSIGENNNKPLAHQAKKADKTTFWGKFMKRITHYVFFCILLAAAQLHAANAPVTKPKNTVKNALKHLESNPTACQTATPILESQINNPIPYTISSPGVYCLATDVSFTPTASFTSAITIDAPNVVLDLNNNTLSQATVTNTGLVGITINGQRNIIIKNGTVSGFNQNGIFTQANTTTSAFNDQLIFENLNVLTNGTAAGPEGVGGIVITNATNVSLEYVNARENFGVGVGLSGVDNFFMDNCRCDDTQPIEFAFPFGNCAIGFYAAVDGPFFLKLREKFEEKKNLKQTPFTTASSNLFVTNCSFNGSTGQNSAFGAAVGNLTTTASARSRNILFENCVATDISAVEGFSFFGLYFGFVEGITVIADNIVIKNFVVDNLATTGTGTPPIDHMVGIEVSASTNALVENCTVATLSGQATYVFGFDIEGFGTNVTHKNCVAYNIVNNNTTVLPAYAAGFALEKPLQAGFNFEGQGVVTDSCIAQNVHGQPQGATAAGIFVSGQQNIQVQNCLSSNNDIGILTLDYIPGPIGTLLTQNGIFENNTVAHNCIAGFSDQTRYANNAYFSNTARSNGPGGLANYVGQIFPTPFCPTSNKKKDCKECKPASGKAPLRLWDIAKNQLCPVNTNCVMGDKLDNLDIRP